MKKEKKVGTPYERFLSMFIKRAQTTHDIPTYYRFRDDEGSAWLMRLPKSVMAQRKLVLMMYDSARHELDPDIDERLTIAIAENCTKDDQPIILEALTYEEIEVMRKTYIDMVLLPLSLRGAKATEAQTLKIMKQNGFKDS